MNSVLIESASRRPPPNGTPRPVENLRLPFRADARRLLARAETRQGASSAPHVVCRAEGDEDGRSEVVGHVPSGGPDAPFRAGRSRLMGLATCLHDVLSVPV